MSEIISCKKAKAQGLRQYFTGRPCKHGHIDFRYVSSWNCVKCDKGKHKKRNRIRDNETTRKWRAANKERVKAYRVANKEKMKIYHHQWHLDNRDKNNERSRLNFIKNRERYREYYKKRRLAFYILKELGIEI
jgi:hypothetical protein